MPATLRGCAATVIFVLIMSVADPLVAQSKGSPPRLDGINSWAYQLQGDLSALPQSHHDLIVVDIDNVEWQSSARALSAKPDGKRRLVVSYLSIGEAEDSRPYFARCCASEAPSWLTGRTQGWPGNYAVRFWQPEWRSIVLERIDALIAAGYGGAFLDRLDIWEVMADERPSARSDMVALVERVATHARARAPEFIILVQNAEELLDDPGHLATIDGVAKEDLFYGIAHDGKRNREDVIDYAMRDLQRARAAGKPVLVVEYAPFDAMPADVIAEIERQGFHPLIADRNLDGK